MRKWLILFLAALLLALPAMAETEPAPTETASVPPAAADKVSVPGAFAVRAGGDLFAAVPDGKQTALVRTAGADGTARLVDRAETIADLVAIDGEIFYLRAEGGETTLARRGADGARSTVYTFEAGAGPHALSAFGSDLYVLIGDQLHVIYPGNGLCLKLVGQRMSEYAIVGGYAYFLSLEDQMSYETASLLGGEDLTVSGGCLYRLDMNSGRAVLLIKAGLADLKYAGGKLYFHNLSDAYVMGSAKVEWMEGRLYSYDIAGQTIKKLLDDYDWGFYPTDAGFAVYTANRITWYPEGRVQRELYSPAGYALLAGDAEGLVAYEPEAGKLTYISYDGVVTDAGNGDLRAAQPDQVGTPGDAAPAGTEPADGAEPTPTPTSVAVRTGTEIFGTAEDGDEAESASSGSGGTSAASGGGTSSGGKSGSSAGSGSGSGKSKGTDSSYIFADSAKRKLSEAEVRALDPDMLGYARNEIYARHGYVFKKGKYASYFAGKSWYNPGGFSEDDLNETEWYNMALIKRVEEGGSGSGSGSSGSGKGKGTDSSYIFASSATKKLTRAQVLAIDKSMWPYARNEIYARHGYVFSKAKFRNYFSKKSWYSPGGFSEDDLSATEWYNMKLIRSLEEEYGVN